MIGGRVTDPNEVIKRSQVVKVKVLSVAGTRISLSLKEVDQRTGEDLAPRSSLPDDVRSTTFAASAYCGGCGQSKPFYLALCFLVGRSAVAL